MKVLIADDELATRLVLSKATAADGHEVLAVPDGRALVDSFGEFEPDIVLVDWEMPLLSGLAAARELRALPGGADVFIIMVTGLDSDPSLALDAGVDDYLLKPVSVARLRALMKFTAARVTAGRVAPASPAVAVAVSEQAQGSPDAAEFLAAIGRVVGVNARGRISFANCRLGDHNQADLIGKAVDSVFASEIEAFSEASLKASATRRPGRFVSRADNTEWTVHGVRRDDRFVGCVLVAEPDQQPRRSPRPSADAPLARAPTQPHTPPYV